MSKSKTSPTIRISYQKNKLVNIGKATLHCLSDPSYIRLMYVGGKNLLVIEGHNEKVKDSIAVPPEVYSDTDKEFNVCRKILTDALRNRLGWDEGVSYRASGKFSQRLGVVVFNLEKAEVLSADT